MIETFRGIWRFAGEEQRNIRRSVIACFFNAVFHMFEIAAIYYTILLCWMEKPAMPRRGRRWVCWQSVFWQRRDQVFLPTPADPRRVLHGGQ